MKRFINYLPILSLLLTGSCVREFDLSDPTLLPGAGEKDVMLKIAVPYAAPQGTVAKAKGVDSRSIGATQENTIETLDILAFKVDGGIETFQYRAKAKKDAGNTEGASVQAFNAKLIVKDYAQRFVLITNAGNKIETLIGSRSDGWVGEDKETFLKNLIINLNGGDRWNVISASNYTSIPMWGETAPKTVNATTNFISDAPIPMLRMIAKIEVQLDVNNYPAIVSDFKLKSVHVYNTNTSGRIVPISDAGYIENMIAKKTSLPYPVTPVVGPIGYTDFTPPGITDIAMKGAIYLFETAAKNVGNILEETCIVVGGLYGTDATPTYYRLDFFASNGTTHLDILRNHRYLCNIVEVGGRGYSTIEEARKAGSFNMKANTLVWGEGEIHNIVFDKRYMLGVSQDFFKLSENAHGPTDIDNILRVTTDYPEGWSATVWADKAGTIPVPNDAVSALPWLRISPALGAGGAQLDEMRLTVDANARDERAAYIHIRAGRLMCLVTVVQEFFVTVGETGSSGERIYIDGTKLMLTQDPNNAGAMFQFGGIRGWNFKTSGSAGNANYNPSPLSSAWNSTWQYANSQGNVVAHTLANLRAGKGDPCRLVGYTLTEVSNAIATTNPNAYAPDNRMWRLLTGNELNAYTVNSVSLPRFGYIDYDGTFRNGDGYYWSSYQFIQSPSENNANFLQVRTGAKIMNAGPQAYGMSIRCVRQ